jgi:ribosome maturation factor RimP
MNDELIAELSEAMKRREKAQAAVARWAAQLNDANEDITELSGRITAAADDDDEEEDEVPVEVESAGVEAPYYHDEEPRFFQPAPVPE